MRALVPCLIACALAAAAPLVVTPEPPADAPVFPGWPTTWEGRPLRPLELPARERVVLDRLPGRVACFTDGERQLVLRWLTAPSADLHPARRCFRGRGYEVSPRDARLDGDGRLWGRFDAAREGERLEVLECVVDAEGRSWPDVSAWYWSQLLAPDPGPWWVVTRAEPAPPEGALASG